MNKLEEEFRKNRRKGVPGYVICTTDTEATIASLLAVRFRNEKDELPPPAVVWDCVRGPVTPVENGTGAQISEPAESIRAEQEGDFVPTGNPVSDLPQVLINAGNKLAENSILFLVVQDNSILDYAPVAQAIHALRDKFKRNLRAIVILGLDIKLPAFLAQDMVSLDDPLPNVTELRDIAQRLVDELGAKVKPKDIEAAAVACMGMTRFLAETSIAVELRSTSIDAKAVSLIRQTTIENVTNKALTFQRESWTFDQIGGQSNFKQFATRLFSGPRRPKGVVLVDEMEKSTAGSSGAAQDNTGAAQYILQSMLTNMENNGWIGMLCAGGPGTGKTLSSICIANQFQVPSLVLDLGATKTKELGGTESNMRQVMRVIYSMFGSDCLFMATVNAVDTIPAALRRRFWLGTWYWDTPNAEERAQIWDIQLKRFSIKEKPTFGHDGWTGSDIRNACQMAWVLNCPLREAAECISLAGQTNKRDIEKLRDTAEIEHWRSASYPGEFKKNKPSTKSRSIIADDN